MSNWLSGKLEVQDCGFSKIGLHHRCFLRVLENFAEQLYFRTPLNGYFSILMIRSTSKLVKLPETLLCQEMFGEVLIGILGFLIFFRVPVVLSTAVVLTGGNKILNEAKKKDFFFIIPSFLNNVSVLLIYCHFEKVNRPIFIFTVSRWKIFFFALPCAITI